MGNELLRELSIADDKVPGEGAVYYDIRFYAYVPVKNERIRLIGTEFTHSHYDNIKKVYSIWLGFNAPDKIGNAISEYSIQKRICFQGCRIYQKLMIKYA